MAAAGELHRDDTRLHDWLEALPAGRHTIEFRHRSWFAPAVLAALREHAVALTIGDHPQRPFQAHTATASWRFIRFHYGSRGRRGNYSDTELETWARRIAQWRRTLSTRTSTTTGRGSRPPTRWPWPAGWGRG